MILCRLLPYNKVNQPWVYMCPLPLEPPPHPPPHPTPLGCHRAPCWAPCVTQQLPIAQPPSCTHSLRPYGLWPARLLCPWDFPRKNTGVSCHFHLQNFPLAIYFTYDNVYVSMLQSQLVLPSPSPLCPKSVFYMGLCSRPANRYHFYRFHKYVFIYICFPLTFLCNRF